MFQRGSLVVASHGHVASTAPELSALSAVLDAPVWSAASLRTTRFWVISSAVCIVLGKMNRAASASSCHGKLELWRFCIALPEHPTPPFSFFGCCFPLRCRWCRQKERKWASGLDCLCIPQDSNGPIPNPATSAPKGFACKARNFFFHTLSLSEAHQLRHKPASIIFNLNARVSDAAAMSSPAQIRSWQQQQHPSARNRLLCVIFSGQASS